MNRNSKQLLVGLAIGLLVFTLMASRRGDNIPVKPAQFTVPALPTGLSFCEEPVPLEQRSVGEKLEREVLYNYYQPHQILYIIKLSRRYFPLIEQRLKANGVPDDMKYLCVAESNLQNAISKVGATGFWQFMKGTAPAYGLEVNAEVDERYHVEKSTDAACKYLKAAYARFGSWTAAAASYNCGQGGFSSRASFQKTSVYYDLALPEETSKYVFRILTFKYFLENAPALGFNVADGEGYDPVPFRKVTINTSIENLTSFAASHSINYQTLVEHNPWIRGRKLTNPSKKKYEFLIPQ